MPAQIGGLNVRDPSVLRQLLRKKVQVLFQRSIDNAHRNRQSVHRLAVRILYPIARALRRAFADINSFEARQFLQGRAK
jgi:hypothetical protein